MIIVLLIGVLAVLTLLWMGWRLWRIRATDIEPLSPPLEFRRVTGHVYRMRLPDRLKLQMKRDDQ